MTEEQIENDRMMVALMATPEEEYENLYQEYHRWQGEGGKGIDPLLRFANKIADTVGVWESKYGDVASNSTVTTRDAVIEDQHGALFSGEDAIRVGRKMGFYNDEDVARFKREKREARRKDAGIAAPRPTPLVRRETKQAAPRATETENTVVMVGRIMTLADFNRSLRARYDGTRAVRDHDLAHAPCRTLADINARWRHRSGRAA